MGEQERVILKAEGPEWFHGRDAYSVSEWDESGEYFRRIVAEIPCREPTGEDENEEPVFGTEEAYARLFAAAPDLLEGCRALLRVHSTSPGGDYVDAVMKISKALAKAEGRG